ncbi:MAG: hypothetical protein AAGA23_23530, partial [Pseudomonadota bacterium]
IRMVGILLLLCAGPVAASVFLPYPFGPEEQENLDQFFFHESGQFGYLTAVDDEDLDREIGSLYVNGTKYLDYGRADDTYSHIYAVSLTGAKVIFSGRVNGESIYGVFDGPMPDTDPPYTSPTLKRLGSIPFPESAGETLSASSSGEFLIQGDMTNWRVYAPDQAFADDESWITPVWSGPFPNSPRDARVLDDGRVVAIVEPCIEVYTRSALFQVPAPPQFGELELETEACLDESQGPVNLFDTKVSRVTGQVTFCLNNSVYSFSGGTLSELPGISCQRVVGSDGSGRVAYQSGIGVYFSDDPSEPFVASGQLIDGQLLGNFSPRFVTGQGTVIGSARLYSVPPSDSNPGVFSDGLLFASGNGKFPPDPNDPPPDLVRWGGAQNGDFFDPDAWNPQTIPDSSQVALFASGAPAVVNFGSQVANSQQLRIESAVVNFAGGGYQLNTGSAATPSFVLEAGPTGIVTTLTIDDGHQFQTRHARIDGENASGLIQNSVILEGDLSSATPQARWDNAGMLVVDGDLAISWSGGLNSDATLIGSVPGTNGEVTVGNDALGCPGLFDANLGATSVGYGGAGRLEISDGCTVFSNNTAPRIIGELAGSVGVVSANDSSSWVGLGDEGDLTIGQAGIGELQLEDGAVSARDVLLGLAATGSGTASISAPTGTVALLVARDEMIVGHAGFGEIMLGSRGQITARNLDLGVSPGGDGRIHVLGDPPFAGTEPNVDVAVDVAVGGLGHGELTLSSNSWTRSESGQVGLVGHGTVRISDTARWNLTGDLQVGSATPGSDPSLCDGGEATIGTGRVEIVGDSLQPGLTGTTLTIDGPQSLLSGTGRTMFTNHIVSNCGTLSPGASPGTLTLDGNLELAGGVLEIEVDGTAAGSFDVLSITGDGNLQGGIIRFVFSSYLPQQGDQVRFLETGGSLTLGPGIEYQYRGAVPGFSFSVTDDGSGNLEFVANNDALGDAVFGNGFE